MLPEVEESHGRLPFVEDRRGGLRRPGGDALHQSGSSHSEETTLIVVTVALVTLQTIGSPELEVQVALLLPERGEVHQEHGGLA